MQLETLLESIKNIVGLKDELKEDSYSTKELLIDLLNIYTIYLENVDDSKYNPVNHDGTLLYEQIQEQVKKNLSLITQREEKTTFGNVPLLPEDDMCDVIIGLENSLHTFENTNKSAFLEEFIFQIKHNIHQYLVNCIVYFSQLESIHN